MTTVLKRNGDYVPFDKNKIIAAISKAFLEVDGCLYETDTIIDIATDIEKYCSNKDIISIEQIQDKVEEYLMRSERPDVARAYIRYRYKRQIARSASDTFMKAIGEKLNGENIENQNANVDEHSFGGRKGEADSILMKKYALDNIVSDMARRNHENNRIYIHDLSDYAVGSHNCLSIPFDHLLADGFNTRQTDIRPANSINTAFQLLAVIFQLQSLQQFGGVSATHLDWTMVPYVRKSFRKHYIDGLKYIENINDEALFQHIPVNAGIQDGEYKLYKGAYNYAMEMTERELQQAVEGMYHNLNTLQSRSGNQLPFTSINYGTCTMPEGRMVIKALLEGSLKGIGKHHRTPIFPCGIFQIGEGINKRPGDPNYDLFRLALKSTAKRLYPNYANIDWSGNIGYDPNRPDTYFSTMGCRTANGWDINGLGQQKDGRGNICPVTIILPTLAMEAKDRIDFLSRPDETPGYVDTFMKILEKAIDDAKDMLLERFNYICSQSPESAKFMYENGLMAGYIPEEGIISALRHGTLAIGQLGLAEALQILVGCNQTTKEGMALAKRIESLFKTKASEFKEQYKLNFGVYYTPKIELGVVQVIV